MAGWNDSTWGLVRESEAEYRGKSQDFLTSHRLADFRKCPALYQRKRLGLVADEDRPAYLVGRAIHTLALEGREEFDRTYAVGGPINERTGRPFGSNTKAWEEWAAAQGKPLLTHEQYDVVRNVAATVSSHPEAGRLFAAGVPEGVARAEYAGKACQIRIDWFNPAVGIIDLKSCDDLTWFEADARRYGYAHQLAFYQAVLAGAVGALAPVHLVAVEKKEPFRCGVWLLSDDALTSCRRENEAAIERLRACESAGVWPTGYEERRVFDGI